MLRANRDATRQKDSYSKPRVMKFVGSCGKRGRTTSSENKYIYSKKSKKSLKI